MADLCVTRRYRFAAAHRLHSDQFSEEENRRIFGKCNNPNGHGHNYTVLVTVRGELDQTTGVVADLEALDRLVADKVVSRFDHQDLNHDPAFQTLVTTGENLVQLIWDLLVEEIRPGRLEKIGLIETRDNYFEYRGPEVRGRATESP